MTQSSLELALPTMVTEAAPVAVVVWPRKVAGMEVLALSQTVVCPALVMVGALRHCWADRTRSFAPLATVTWALLL